MTEQEFDEIINRVIEGTIRKKNKGRTLFVILDIDGSGCGIKVDLDTKQYKEMNNGKCVNQGTLTNEQIVTLIVESAAG